MLRYVQLYILLYSTYFCEAASECLSVRLITQQISPYFSQLLVYNKSDVSDDPSVSDVVLITTCHLNGCEKYYETYYEICYV